jgi:hypothetical protein
MIYGAMRWKIFPTMIILGVLGLLKGTGLWLYPIDIDLINTWQAPVLLL